MENKIILLVEDNPDDELLTIRALKKNGINNKIVVAHDGVEALDFLFATGTFSDRNPKDLPVLILLDLKLPKLNGLDVLKRLRENLATKYIPVVILSSSSEVQDILSSYDLGANSFVQKPVDFDEFLETARQMGFYWLLINRPVSMDLIK